MWLKNAKQNLQEIFAHTHTHGHNIVTKIQATQAGGWVDNWYAHTHTSKKQILTDVTASVELVDIMLCNKPDTKEQISDPTYMRPQSGQVHRQKDQAVAGARRREEWEALDGDKVSVLGDSYMTMQMFLMFLNYI